MSRRGEEGEEEEAAGGELVAATGGDGSAAAREGTATRQPPPHAWRSGHRSGCEVLFPPHGGATDPGAGRNPRVPPRHSHTASMCEEVEVGCAASMCGEERTAEEDEVAGSGGGNG
jgi:hypothetical protein